MISVSVDTCCLSVSLFVSQPMEMAEGDVQFRPRIGKAASAPLLPEVEAYLQLLLVVHLTNNKRYTEVCVCDCAGFLTMQREAWFVDSLC